jgi:hypothetical protein
MDHDCQSDPHSGERPTPLILADSEAPQRPPKGLEQPSTTLDHWAQLALRIGGRLRVGAHGSGLVMRRSSAR